MVHTATMRPVVWMLLIQLGCRGEPRTVSTTDGGRPPPDRVLVVAGPHALREARWSAHRVVARSEREIWFFDPAHPDDLRVQVPPAPPASLVAEPTSPIACVNLIDGRSLTFEGSTLLHEHRGTSYRGMTAISPDGRWLLDASGGDAPARVVKARSGALVSSFEDGYEGGSFDPSGTYPFARVASCGCKMAPS